MRVSFASVLKLLQSIFIQLLVKMARNLQFLVKIYQSYKTKVEPLVVQQWSRWFPDAIKIPSFKNQQISRFNASMDKYKEHYLKQHVEENANIDPILYNFEERKVIFVDPENMYEKQWKSRILYVNTPRGNVLMYYNPFALAFSYYSDEQIIPYWILQKLAKKYVVMFQCKDFFIDVEGRPDNKLFELLKHEDEALKTKHYKIPDITKLNLDNKKPLEQNLDAYSSVKSFRVTESTSKENPGGRGGSFKNVKSKKPLTAQKYANKFVRIGKINENNILQKPPSKNIQATNELLFGPNSGILASKYIFDDLEIIESPNEVIEPNSYAMFKKLKANANATAN